MQSLDNVDLSRPKALGIMLPLLLKKGINNEAKEVQALSVSMVLPNNHYTTPLSFFFLPLCDDHRNIAFCVQRDCIAGAEDLPSGGREPRAVRTGPRLDPPRGPILPGTRRAELPFLPRREVQHHPGGAGGISFFSLVNTN